MNIDHSTEAAAERFVEFVAKLDEKFDRPLWNGNLLVAPNAVGVVTELQAFLSTIEDLVLSNSTRLPKGHGAEFSRPSGPPLVDGTSTLSHPVSPDWREYYYFGRWYRISVANGRESTERKLAQLWAIAQRLKIAISLMNQILLEDFPTSERANERVGRQQSLCHVIVSAYCAGHGVAMLDARFGYQMEKRSGAAAVNEAKALRQANGSGGILSFAAPAPPKLRPIDEWRRRARLLENVSRIGPCKDGRSKCGMLGPGKSQ